MNMNVDRGCEKGCVVGVVLLLCGTESGSVSARKES